MNADGNWIWFQQESNENIGSISNFVIEKKWEHK